MSKLRVFVSSTYYDLKYIRKDLENFIKSRGHEPVLFESGDITFHNNMPLDESCYEAVRNSDMQVLIIGGRYGSKSSYHEETNEEIAINDKMYTIYNSITKQEYLTAKENGIPVYIFVDKGVYNEYKTYSKNKDNHSIKYASVDSINIFKLLDDIFSQKSSDFVKDFDDFNDIAEWLTKQWSGLLWNYVNYVSKGKAPRIEDPYAKIDSRDVLVSDSPNQLEKKLADFIGRKDEIEEIQKSLRDSNSTRIHLFGNGGTGKTTLAIELAWILHERFPDGQIVVDMQGLSENPLAPYKAMEKIIQSYNEGESLPKNENDIVSKYITMMNRKRALILLDNAAGDYQINPLIKPASCGFIITSRRRFTVIGAVQKKLDNLKKDKAVELLLNIWVQELFPSNGYIDWNIWERIALLCDNHPLALRAAGSFLANTRDKHPETYAQELQFERTRLKKIGSEGVELGVDASFNLSYQQLSKDTANVFRLLSIFPSDFDAEAEEVICKDVEHNHLSELVRWSLVAYHEKVRRYNLHDLVRIFAASHLSEDDYEKELTSTQQRFAEHYKDVLSKFDKIYYNNSFEKSLDGLIQFDREWANIQAGHKWSEENSDRNYNALVLCGDYPVVGVHLLSLRQHPEERIQWSKVGLIAARRQRNPKMECFNLGMIGWAYMNLSKTHEAIGFFEQALAISQNTGDLNAEGANLAGLGQAYENGGDIQKAIDYKEQALTTARQVGNLQSQIKALSSLGRTYVNINEITKAIRYFEQALDISRNIGNTSSEAFVLAGLGRAWADQGDTQKAIGYFKQALNISRKIGDLKGESVGLAGLGRAYADLGETRTAIQHFEQALTNSQKRGHLRGERVNLSSLGRAWADIGEADKAKQCFEQALSIAQEIKDTHAIRAIKASLGRVSAKSKQTQKLENFELALATAREKGDFGEEKTALIGLGRFFAKLGEADKAKQYFEKALAIARKTGDRETERNSLAGLGRVNADVGETQKAKQYFQQGLAIARETEDREAERNILAGLGRVYADLGEIQQAIQYDEQALSLAQELEDKNAEAANLAGLGRAYSDIGEKKKAIKHFKQALTISQEKGDFRKEAANLASLGRTYADLGEIQEAIKYFQRALAISRKVDNPGGEAANLAGLGRAYAVLGEMHKTLQYFQQALIASRKANNPQGEAANLAGMGRAYIDLGEIRKAIQHFEQALAISRKFGNEQDEAANLAGLGRAYTEFGEIRKAIQHFEQALAISRKFGYEQGEAANLAGLGRAFADLGEMQRAVQYFEQALSISRKFGHEQGEAANLAGLGRAFADLGEMQRAVQYFEQALSISLKIGNRQGEAANLAGLGRAFADLGETKRAVQYFEQALSISQKIRNRQGEATNLAGLGRTFADLGETQRAVQYFEQALSISRETGNRQVEAIVLFEKSVALNKQGQRTDALLCAKGALKILEEIESRHADKVRQKLVEWKE